MKVHEVITAQKPPKPTKPRLRKQTKQQVDTAYTPPSKAQPFNKPKPQNLS